MGCLQQVRICIQKGIKRRTPLLGKLFSGKRTFKEVFKMPRSHEEGYSWERMMEMLSARSIRKTNEPEAHLHT